MEKLDRMFWIDQQKLKDISRQFEVELERGLKENNQNIVCISGPGTLRLNTDDSTLADEHNLGVGSTTWRRKG